MFVKTKVVLDHVLVPLQHEPSAGVPSYIEALVTTLPQPSGTLSPSDLHPTPLHHHHHHHH